MPLGLERYSHLAPTILMNMLNPQRPRIHDADYGMSVHRELNEAVLVEGSVNTPGALYRHDHELPRFRLVIIGYVADPHLPTASITQPGLYTSSDVFSENPPSRYLKAFVSIDFGAACSGVSYTISSNGEVREILVWPGSSRSFSKIPTCLVYDALGDVRAWGLEATDISLKKGWVRCEWFKLWLDLSSVPSTFLESRVFQPPKNIMDVVADYLSCIWTHTKNQIHGENGPCSLSHAEVYLTVPSSWDLRTSLLLREAAIKAGVVVQDSEFEDIYWQERLHIIPETEVSVIHSVLSSTFKFPWDQSLTICDAGGATVVRSRVSASGTSLRKTLQDLATYNALQVSEAPKIVETAPRSGSYCGSLFLDLRFRELVQARLAAHPVHLDEASLAHFVRSFSGFEKLAYNGLRTTQSCFDSHAFMSRISHDPAVGLDHGELVIPGDVLRREIFDPVVEQVLHSIATHVEASKVRLDILLLVGGFSTNEYLFRRITEQFGSSIVSIIRPADVSCHGGPRFGVGSLVSSVIHPRNVFLRVALPAEREDRMMRPIYITSVGVCEHRVQYISRRGASIVKGSRSELRVRKLCTSRYDHAFELVLYISNGEHTRRYFDQEEGEELCRCRVDLGTYPSFREQVEASPFGNFYVDFVLGFEMSSAGCKGTMMKSSTLRQPLLSPTSGIHNCWIPNQETKILAFIPFSGVGLYSKYSGLPNGRHTSYPGRGTRHEGEEVMNRRMVPHCEDNEELTAAAYSLPLKNLGIFVAFDILSTDRYSYNEVADVIQVVQSLDIVALFRHILERTFPPLSTRPQGPHHVERLPVFRVPPLPIEGASDLYGCKPLTAEWCVTDNRTARKDNMGIELFPYTEGPRRATAKGIYR
ncbi:hypothetical protein BS47DRAFT_1486679 [Hydnum rufescens UP504]|uniref:Uncharacterized protein n=1 Tax=Hydnum rufescens UP504 TaxID=1448309 RepID=A0A9P6AU46_9AGAM|nr:hypothetical protein BS47DRAFT_1486679 [Hydnum rufescens UP504]